LCYADLLGSLSPQVSPYIKVEATISEEGIIPLKPTLDDLSKAEESLRVAEADINEMSAFNKGNYNRAMSDLYLWRRDYHRAIQAAKLAKEQYTTLEHLDDLVSYMEARLSLLTKLAMQQTDAEEDLEIILDECSLTDDTC